MLVPDSGQYFWLRGLARQMRRISFVGSFYDPGMTMRRDLLRVLIEELVAEHQAAGTLRRADSPYVPAPEPASQLRCPGRSGINR